MVNRERPAVPVEKDKVEWEAHAEGVDGAAAGDQQTGPRLLAVEVGETEQAGAEVDGDRDPPALHGGDGKVAQATGNWLGCHGG